jgi:internalin A
MAITNMAMTNITGRIGLFVAALSLVSSPLVAEDLFPDKGLEAAVRREVFAKRDNQEPLTAEDVKNISQVRGRGKGIKSLQGLEHCRSLALIELAENEIVDLAPIKDLTVLQSVDFANNKIVDVKPLEGLVGLQYLELSANSIVDVTPLSALENMRSLYLSGNQVKDLAALSGLKKMWSLYLDGNPLGDLSPLAELTKLESLDLRKTGISDLAHLAGYTELDYLLLDGNKLTDLSVLVAMAQKDAEGQKRFAPFVKIYLAGNPLSDEAKGAQVEQLKKVGCRVHLDAAE